MAILFYKRLKNKAWPRATLEPIFIAAHEKISTQPRLHEKKEREELNPKKLVILHLEYHENDIPRKLMRKHYDETLGEVLTRDINDGGLAIERAIIAYSRPPNLRDLLQSSKLIEEEGKEVSTFFGD